MACSYFAPDLPVETDVQKSVWLARFKSNLYNSPCIQQKCSSVCLPGNPVLSSACKSCLERNNCKGTRNCLNCLGVQMSDLEVFNNVYNCTVPDSNQPLSITLYIMAALIIIVLFIGVVTFLLRKNRIISELSESSEFR